jgi:hypothetical protein
VATIDPFSSLYPLRSAFKLIKEARQWPTIVSLVAVGMEVSIASACVSRLTLHGVTYQRCNQRPMNCGSNLTSNFMVNSLESFKA